MNGCGPERQKCGGILIEVMIASFVLALGFAGVLVSFSSLTRTVRLVDTEMRTMHRARQELETLRTFSYSSGALSSGTHSITGGLYVVSAYSQAGTKQVTLSLDVIAPNGSTSQVALTTVLASTIH